MSPDETVVLARYVRALCPQQKFDEFTPDAWHDVLGHCPLNDAREAAARIARSQPFVAPAEIIAEIKRLRAERLDGFRYEPQPGDDNPARYLASYRAQRAAVADGCRPAAIERPALPGPSVAEVLGDAIGQTVPTDDTASPERSPLAVRCPKCGARIGHHCRWPGGIRRATHGARTRLAQGTPTQNPDTDPAVAARRNAAAAALTQLTDDERAALAAFQQQMEDQ